MVELKDYWVPGFGSSLTIMRKKKTEVISTATTMRKAQMYPNEAPERLVHGIRKHADIKKKAERTHGQRRSAGPYSNPQP